MKAIMMYHSIDRSGSPISIDPDTFARHVQWFATARVRVVPLEQLASDHGPDHVVSLTFDDAFTNFGSVAAPLLAEHDIPATVFVVSRCVGGSNSWGGVSDPGIPTLRLMDWDGIVGLARAGFSIGGHSRTHPRLGAVSATQLADEIEGCADDILRRVGMRPATFAYPYGETSTLAIQSARNAYAYTCTTQLRVLNDAEDPATLPRLDAYYFRSPGILESWGSPSFMSYIRRRAFARRARARILKGLGRIRNSA